MLGRTLRTSGDRKAAVAAFERALALGQPQLDLLTDLVGTLADLGEDDRAFGVIERGRQMRGGDPQLDILQARLSFPAGPAGGSASPGRKGSGSDAGQCGCRHAAGAPAWRRQPGSGEYRAAPGLTANPQSVMLLTRLIENLTRSRYGDEAQHLQEAYELSCRLLQTDPGSALAHAKALRTAFLRCLDHDRLEASGRLADLVPRWIADGEIAGLHYELGNVHSMQDRLDIVEWHRAWGRREARTIMPLTLPAAPALATGRKLRIGFMSSDLRDHPVTYFALPLLEQYDRDRVEVFCYSFNERERDPVQVHIEQQVTGFRWWPRRPSAEVAAGIAEDALDMLFELGGTTAMNKLDVMTYRPARIGASWLGYPHSAGLEAIDYILVDPYIRPSDPRLLIEQPFVLAESWVALSRMGFSDVPIEASLPEERRGALTFGTMNNPYKFTRACLDAWAAVLRAVPDSRFLFVRPEARTPAFVANVRAAFAARDVDPDRIDYVGVRGRHMPHYNSIDIALDSLPHVGGTTTCETLWMGVPCVSLVGPGCAERLSYSNLTNAGVGDLAVFSVEDYVQTAATLAADPQPAPPAAARAARHDPRQPAGPAGPLRPLPSTPRPRRLRAHEGGDPGRRPRHADFGGDLGPAEADGRDRRAADPLAHHEDLHRHGVTDFVICLGYKGSDQGVLPELPAARRGPVDRPGTGSR